MLEYGAAHNVAVYTGVDAAQLAPAIPGAVAAGERLIAPVDLDAMQAARRLGLPAISPLEVDYEWAGTRKPFSHQRVMAGFMALHPRCFNLADMGTGKTLAVLWAADYLLQRKIIRNVLILAPLSTLNRVWGDEIYRTFLDRRRVQVVYGPSPEYRLRALARPADFYIANHDSVSIGAGKTKQGGLAPGTLARRFSGFDLVVVDEASAFKDHTTRRSKILRSILEGNKRVWLLTGTPTPNSPLDAWGLCHLINAKMDVSYRAFQDMTMQRVSTFKWTPRPESPELARQLLTPAIRYRRDDCIDIPPCTIEGRECTLSPVQGKALAQLKRECAMTFCDGTAINAVNEAVMRAKLIQVACGAVYGQDGSRTVTETDAGPRLAAVREVVEEAPAKIIVFAPLTAVVTLVYNFLRRTQGDAAVAMVTGGTSAKERDRVFGEFQIPEHPLRVIVADPGTMSHGLTLTEASTVLWYAPTDRPETYTQANARVTRPGQTRKTTIVQLYATAVEREIFRRLEAKQALQGVVLDLVKEGR